MALLQMANVGMAKKMMEHVKSNPPKQGIYKGTGTVSKSRDAITDVINRGDSAQ